jgi:hypothetical protein
MAVLTRAFHVGRRVSQVRPSISVAIPDTIGRFTLQPQPAGGKQAVYHRAITIPPQGRFTLALPSLSGAVCDDVNYSMEACPSVRARLESDTLVFDSDLDDGHDVEVTVSFRMEGRPSRPQPAQAYPRRAK